jgi:hypothetical protein
MSGLRIIKAEHIIQYSTERYFDIDSSRQIVVGFIDKRLIVIPYEENDNIITPVTIHETDRKQINFRIKNGRFVR